MWAQLIKARIKPGCEGDLQKMYEEYERRVGPESGWIRSYSLRNGNDPRELTALVIFESEARAREWEHSPVQAEFTGRLATYMDGQPAFVDFDAVTEFAPAAVAR